MHIKRIFLIVLTCIMIITMLSSCFPLDWIKEQFKKGDESIDTPPPVVEISPLKPKEEATDNIVDIDQVQKEFDEFLQKDFLESITDDTLSLHSYLRNPKEFGIEQTEVTWGDLNIYPTAESIEKDKAAIEEFNSFNRENLTEEQKRSYDIYSYFIEIYDATLDTWMMYDPLVGANGYHAVLPFIMNEFTFDTQQDIDDYLILLETIDSFIDYFIDWQKERSRLGLFMSDAAAEEVISVSEDISKEFEKSIFITGFNDKVKEVIADITLTNEYIEKNKQIYKEVVVTSYIRLIDEMKALKGTGKDKGGLAKYDKGKEYYKVQLRRMGFTRTPEEMIEMLDIALSDTINEFYSVYMIYLNRFDPDTLNDMFTPKLSAEEIVAYLIECCANDFPQLPEGTSYSLKHINESMRDSLSAGFYFSPPLDDYSENSIYYNPEYLTKNRDYMFFLMAHEGIPGHLLQNVTLMNSSLSNWRRIVNFKGYGEGWAQYVQYYSYKYITDADQNLVKINRLTEEIDMLTMARIDLGIHYEGWSVSDLRKYMKDNLPFELDNSFFESYYEFIVVNPLQPIPYICGLLEIRELYSRYKGKMGESFSDKGFHTELLKYGEAPFSLLQDWLDDSMLKKTWWQ